MSKLSFMDDLTPVGASDSTTEPLIHTTGTSIRILQPLTMTWNPKEDITVYELAQCLPYLFRISYIMPYEIDKQAPYMRHFKIIDPNEK